MIAANDLRIGNLILHNKDIVKVTEIVNLNNGYCINGIGLNGYTHYGNVADYFEPIPLTEKILLDCGFKQNRDKWFEINYFTDCKESAEKMGILINLVSNRCGIIDTDTDEQSAMTANRVYYLHELQNLFYSLTKTELTINL